MSKAFEKPVVILGAGPAGLTAGYDLLKRGSGPVVIVESLDQVGGIAKTVNVDGFRFDLGPHRFFTKSDEVTRVWDELLGDEFQLVPRETHIYWNKKFLDYPLRGPDVIRKLGPVELTRALLSYLAAVARPKGDEENFEEWVSNRFGRRLFNLFFKSYTEKVWGVPTSEIRAEWAAQRIKGLSFFSAAKAAFFGNRGNKVKSLIDQFHYPRRGAGQMWETMAERVRELGGEIRLNAPVTGVNIDGGRVVSVEAGGETIECSHCVSSLALREIVGLARPALDDGVKSAAQGLRYRDMLHVAVFLEGRCPFPDNWIYIHEPDVIVGRMQNPSSFSPEMVPAPDKSSVVMEYFCFEGDEIWSMDDDKLIELGVKELDQLGLVPPERVIGGRVVRVPKTYPMYDEEYADRVEAIRSWLDSVENLQQVGRNGLHRYNNQDHSMLTAFRAVDNIVDGAGYDIWLVNAESAYHEEVQEDEQPYKQVPETPGMKEPLAGSGVDR